MCFFLFFVSITVRHCQDPADQEIEPYVFHPCDAIKCTRFTQCGASQCNSTCTEYLNPQKDCEVTWGCRCADNQYLDTDGTCVTSEQCKACSEIKCEEDKPCGYFTECNSNCKGVTDPETCSNEVQIGCRCREGSYLTSDGKCVQKEECPSNICNRILCNRGFVCGPFTQCSATCTGVTDPKTCSNELQTGCHCPEDSYLSIYGNCVKKDDCISITCKECERNGTKCGEIDQCKRSCPALMNPETECDGTVRFGCDCPPGSVFESTNPPNVNCILEEECKEICTKCYEMKRECKSFNYCERSCVIFDPTAGKCGPFIKFDCDCPDGYYHWNGDCVTEEECRKNFGV